VEGRGVAKVVVSFLRADHSVARLPALVMSRPVWNRQVDPVARQALPVVVPIALNRVPDPV
jgi:hypothetical protein